MSGTEDGLVDGDKAIGCVKYGVDVLEYGRTAESNQSTRCNRST